MTVTHCTKLPKTSATVPSSNFVLVLRGVSVNRIGCFFGKVPNGDGEGWWGSFAIPKNRIADLCIFFAKKLQYDL